MTQEVNFAAPEIQAVLGRVRKLLALASNNPNSNEAAAAAGKAQTLLAEHNLELAMLENEHGSAKDSREDRPEFGGQYEWQRELWRAVAELNFCLYWHDKVLGHHKDDKHKKGPIQKRAQHRLVGRKVNVAATIVLAGYLQQAIERERRAEFTEQHLHSVGSHSFKQGAVDKLAARLRNERKRRIDEEKAKAAADAVRNTAEARGSALTIADLSQREEDANNDFLYGDGYSARNRAEISKYHADARVRAEARKVADEKLKREDPEAYERQQAEARAAFEDLLRRHRRRGPGSRGGRSHERRVDWESYAQGEKAGERINLDKQVEDRQQTEKRLVDK